MKNEKKVVKSEKSEKKSAARAIDVKTGCKSGTKGVIVGNALLSSKDPVKVFAAVTAAIKQFFIDAKHDASEAHVRRHSIGWINTLKMQHPQIYKDCGAGVEYSRAFRAAAKAALKKTEPKKSEAKKSEAKKSKPVKSAKSAAKKAVKSEKTEAATPVNPPAEGSQF